MVEQQAALKMAYTLCLNASAQTVNTGLLQTTEPVRALHIGYWMHTHPLLLIYLLLLSSASPLASLFPCHPSSFLPSNPLPKPPPTHQSPNLARAPPHHANPPPPSLPPAAPSKKFQQRP